MPLTYPGFKLLNFLNGSALPQCLFKEIARPQSPRCAHVVRATFGGLKDKHNLFSPKCQIINGGSVRLGKDKPTVKKFKQVRGGGKVFSKEVEEKAMAPAKPRGLGVLFEGTGMQPDKEFKALEKPKPSLVWVGGRYGICRDCARRDAPECEIECRPPNFGFFTPWYERK